MSLKETIKEDMKAAMRAKETARLSTIRLLQAGIKQREVDEQIELDDANVISVIEKMLKQRRDSIAAYESAKRDDLASVEKQEVAVLQAYLPKQLDADEVNAIIDEAIQASGAESMKDMGKVMAIIKPKVAGRADMGQLSGMVKSRLN